MLEALPAITGEHLVVGMADRQASGVWVPIEAQRVVKPEVDVLVGESSDGTQTMLHDRRQILDACEMNQIGQFKGAHPCLQLLLAQESGNVCGEPATLCLRLLEAST